MDGIVIDSMLAETGPATAAVQQKPFDATCAFDMDLLDAGEDGTSTAAVTCASAIEELPSVSWMSTCSIDGTSMIKDPMQRTAFCRFGFERGSLHADDAGEDADLDEETQIFLRGFEAELREGNRPTTGPLFGFYSSDEDPVARAEEILQIAAPKVSRSSEADSAAAPAAGGAGAGVPGSFSAPGDTTASLVAIAPPVGGRPGFRRSTVVIRQDPKDAVATASLSMAGSVARALRRGGMARAVEEEGEA